METIEGLVKDFGRSIGKKKIKELAGKKFSVEYLLFKEKSISDGNFYGKIECYGRYAWHSISLPCEVSLLSYSKIKNEIRKQLSYNKSASIRISDNKVQLKINKKTFVLYKF